MVSWWIGFDLMDFFVDTAPKFIGFLIWIEAWLESIIGDIKEIHLTILDRKEFSNRFTFVRWCSAKNYNHNLNQIGKINAGVSLYLPVFGEICIQLGHILNRL